MLLLGFFLGLSLFIAFSFFYTKKLFFVFFGCIFYTKKQKDVK